MRLSIPALWLGAALLALCPLSPAGRLEVEDTFGGAGADIDEAIFELEYQLFQRVLAQKNFRPQADLFRHGPAATATVDPGGVATEPAPPMGAVPVIPPSDATPTGLATGAAGGAAGDSVIVGAAVVDEDAGIGAEDTASREVPGAGEESGGGEELETAPADPVGAADPEASVTEDLVVEAPIVEEAEPEAEPEAEAKAEVEPKTEAVIEPVPEPEPEPEPEPGPEPEPEPVVDPAIEAARREAEAAAEAARLQRELVERCEMQTHKDFALMTGATMTPNQHLSRCKRRGNTCECVYLIMERNGNLLVTQGPKMVSPTAKNFGDDEILWSSNIDADMYVKDGKYALSLEQCKAASAAGPAPTHCATVRRTYVRAGQAMPLVWQSPAKMADPFATPVQEKVLLPRTPLLLISEEPSLQLLAANRVLLWTSAPTSAEEEAAEKPAAAFDQFGLIDDDEPEENQVLQIAREKAKAYLQVALAKTREVLLRLKNARVKACTFAGHLGDDSDFFLQVYDYLIKFHICKNDWDEDEDDDGEMKLGGAPLPGQAMKGAAAAPKPSMLGDSGAKMQRSAGPMGGMF